MRLGLRGAALCTHSNSRDLDAGHLDEIFAVAQELDIPLFLHPQNSGDLTRMKDCHLWNMVGFQFETALAASRLVMSGTFERFPGLNVVLAHGGGFRGRRADVFWGEPPHVAEPFVPDELGKLDNVILAPHNGGATWDVRISRTSSAAKSLVQLIRGERPARLLNPEIYEVA